MDRLKSLLRAGERPVMGIYLRILAAVYLAGVAFHFSNMLGIGAMDWGEMPLAWKNSEFFYAVFFMITALGLWLRRPWGILCFFPAALSQLILYWGFPEMVTLTDEHLQIIRGIINIHISTFAIFFIIRVKGR